MEAHFLFEECLGDKIKGKVFVDIGSRTGASLYMVIHRLFFPPVFVVAL